MLNSLYQLLLKQIKKIFNFINLAYLQEVVADLISVVFILLICFVVGMFVRTKLGGYIHTFFEKNLLKRIPSYGLLKETVSQFMSGRKALFSSVALVDIFGNDTLVTAFIADEHSDGRCTVFIPTGPNPTSGFVVHVKSEHVYKIDIPIEDAMRSIISVGLGSGRLIEEYLEKRREPSGRQQAKGEGAGSPSEV